MYKRILLAADGSENSLRAAAEAVKLASHTTGAVVDILYVADYSMAKNEVLHAYGSGEAELNRRRKLLPIEELLQAESINYELHMVHGEPGPSIVDYASKHSSDLVVIGSRGLNTLQEMVLGSVSHKVVKNVHCPVLVVK